MSKICEQCQAEFKASRNDARFCSQSCKSKYWYNQKNKETGINEVKNDLHATLKGVIDETIETSQALVDLIGRNHGASRQSRVAGADNEAPGVGNQHTGAIAIDDGRCVRGTSEAAVFPCGRSTAS